MSSASNTTPEKAFTVISTNTTKLDLTEQESLYQRKQKKNPLAFVRQGFRYVYITCLPAAV
jgi:hypothetical protein